MMANLVAPFDMGRMMLRTTRSLLGIRRVRRALPEPTRARSR